MEKMQRFVRRVGLCSMLSLGLGVAGCSLAPEYIRPAAPVPASWAQNGTHGSQAQAIPLREVMDLGWKAFYLDPKLQKILALGLANNRDLRVALLNVERSQAQYRIQWSALVPKLDANGVGTFAELSKDFTGEGKSRDSHQYTVALGVTSYELDLFGRVRSLKDQALAQYLATEQAQRSAQISLIGQIATSYLTLAADLESLQVARDTLQTQEISYTLIQQRSVVGASSDLDLREAQSQVDSARADVARLTSQADQEANNLQLLVGASIPADLLPTALNDTVDRLAGITPGLSSEVLLKRPDVLQAEHQLQGYQANIGAARAAFFPKITLVGTAGSGSSELSNLFTAGSGSWTFIPRIDLPIFDAGERMALLQVAKADRDIALAQYEKTIQTAFREVADALAQRQTLDQQLAAQQSLQEALAKRYALARERYNVGVDNHLTLLDAQRSLYSAQQGLVSVRLARLTNLVALYKTLGGGVKTER